MYTVGCRARPPSSPLARAERKLSSLADIVESAWQKFPPRARPLETGNEQRNRGKRSDSPSLDIQPGGDADRSGGTGRCVWAISGLRTVTWTALAGLVALSVVAKGVLSLKAGMFTMPDPQHASWQFLIPAILRSLQAERVVREAHGGVSRS